MNLPSRLILTKRLPHAHGLPLPQRMSAAASGHDVVAAVESDLTIAPGARALAPTGLIIEIPAGFEVQVRPRSGLAVKHGVTVLNAPGTIDADYRGEVKVILINHGSEPFTVRRGDRIAQLVVARVESGAAFVEAEDVSETDRGAGGFGSSGK